MELDKIRKGTPIPTSKQGVTECRYPLREMEIGDSFITECTGCEHRHRISSYIHRHAKTLKMKFTVRKNHWADRTAEVWRIS